MYMSFPENYNFEGSLGFPITIHTGMDLTNATATIIEVKKPDGSTTTWTAAVSGDATLGKIAYTIASALVSGNYQLQPRIEFTSSRKQYGRVLNFFVMKRPATGIAGWLQ